MSLISGKLEEEIIKYHIRYYDISNMDEKGFRLS